MHHGIEYREIARDLSKFDGHAHGDEELLSYPLPRTDFRDPYCVLCNVVFEGFEDKGQINATRDDEPRRIFATSTDHAEPSKAFRGRAPPLFV